MKDYMFIFIPVFAACMFMVIASCAINNSQNKHFKPLKILWIIPPFLAVILHTVSRLF